MVRLLATNFRHFGLINIYSGVNNKPAWNSAKQTGTERRCGIVGNIPKYT